MNNESRFDNKTLRLLEEKLWELIENHAFYQDSAPPPIEGLLADIDECASYAKALETYAYDLMRGQESKWLQHPFLQHLEACAACRQRLEEMTDAYTQAPHARRRNDQDIDITLFNKHLPQTPDKVRGPQDARRPVLLSAGLLQEPQGWYYSLEQINAQDTSRPGLLLSLIDPQGGSGPISVRLVLLHRILHGVTDENGQLFFPDIEAPRLDDPLIPAINIHLHLLQ